MAGLVAAARARELGADVRVLEKGDRAGRLDAALERRRSGATATSTSSGGSVPGGDPALQRLVWERLDDALDWLERLGAPVVARDTENPLTTGRRFDPRGLTDALVRAAGEVGLGRAGGGRGGAARRWRPAAIRAIRSSSHAIAPAARSARAIRGATVTASGSRSRAAARLAAPSDEFYGRAMPARAGRPRSSSSRPRPALRPAARGASNDRGEEFFPGEVSWSENDLAQAIAAQPGGRRLVRARRRGARRRRPVVEAAGLPSAHGDRAAVPAERSARSRAARRSRTPTAGCEGRRARRASAADGLWAAGVDAGGISNGGYASGLAQALVLGLVAAEDACSVAVELAEPLVADPEVVRDLVQHDPPDLVP